MNYFVKTPSNEWDAKKAFNDYLQSCDGDEIVDKMKQDLIELKNSQNIGINIKRKVENFILTLDKKKAQLRTVDSNPGAHNIFNQQNSSGVINNNMKTVNINNKRESVTSTLSSNKKQKKKSAATSNASPSIRETEIENLFNPCSSYAPASAAAAASDLALPRLPTRVEDLDPSDFQPNTANPYMVNDKNISSIFCRYQQEVVKKNNKEGLLVECNTYELLALNNILLLKNGQCSSCMRDFFSEETMKDIKLDIKKKLNITTQSINTDFKNGVDSILKEYKDGEIACKTASRRVNMYISENTQFHPLDSVLVGIQNLIQKIPKQKFNGLIRENTISCSYVESVLGPMFTDPDKSRYLQWLNTKVLKDSSKQFDFAVNELTSSNWTGPILVGEVKGEDQREDKYICLLDLLRIGAACVDSIHHNQYDAVLGVHIVGLQMTFYITTLQASGMYIMLEIATVTLPRDATELRSYLANADDLLTVLQYADYCKVSDNKEKLKSMSAATISTPEFERFIACSRDRQRECPIVYQH